MPQLSRCALPVLAAAALPLAGCAGSGSSATRPAPTSSVTATVTMTPQASSPAADTTSAAPSGPATCDDSAIRASVGRQGAGLGNNFTVLVFHNVSSKACYLRGYPGVTPYVHQEQGSPAKRSTTGYFGSAKVRTVLVHPGGAASAMIDGSDSPVGKKRSCPTYTSLKVTPPNLYNTVTLEVKIPACARLSVEPVTSGSRGTVGS